MIKMTGSEFLELGEKFGCPPYYDENCLYLLMPDDKEHWMAYCAEDDEGHIKYFSCCTEFKYDEDWERVKGVRTEIFKDEKFFVKQFHKSCIDYKKAKNDYELELIDKDFE
jgi:hypothetical protein